MKYQQLRVLHRGVVCKRAAIASAAAAAMLAAYIAPATGSAEVVLKQEYMTANQARLTHGEDLYNELCAVCHGQSGKGDGPAVPALKQRPIDLTALMSSNEGEFPREALQESIYGRNRIEAHGTLDMPIWGRAFEFTKPDWSRAKRKKFAEHRIHNIVDYIESLQVSQVASGVSGAR